MAKAKQDRTESPLRGGGSGDPASATGPVFSREARQDARRAASESLDAELEADSAVPKLFAASYDTRGGRLLFLSPSVPAGGGHLPAARPELLLYQAVIGLFQRLTAVGPGGPSIPEGGTTPPYVHLSGRASANAVREPLSAALITAYLASVAGSGDPGQGLEIRPKDGSRVAVTLSADAGPTMPAAPPPDLTAGPLPSQTLTDLLSLRRSLLPHHQTVVGAVQRVLDQLAGKRGETIEVNREVAATVNGVTDDYGVALVFDGRPVAVRVVPLKTDPAGSFQVRLTGSDQKALKTSMAFPPLTAVSKAALPGATPVGPSGDPSGSADE